MCPTRGLIKWANPDAAGTRCAIPRPKSETLFPVNGPPQQALPVGYVKYFPGGLSIHNSSTGAVFSALLTLNAEIPNHEFNWFIGDQW